MATANFERALAFLATPPPGESVDASVATKLKFYGLFKQAMKGDCTASKPWAYQVEAAAKWSAWDSQRGQSKSEAKAAYVALLESVAPGFDASAGAARAADASTREQSPAAAADGDDDDDDVALALAAARALKQEFDRDSAQVAQIEASMGALGESGAGGEAVAAAAAAAGAAHADAQPPAPYYAEELALASSRSSAQPTVAQISIVMAKMHERFKALVAENEALCSTVAEVQIRIKAVESMSLLQYVAKLAAQKRTRVVLGGAALALLALLAVRWVARRVARALRAGGVGRKRLAAR
jgi:acyl-CoA-binding protein